MWVDVAVFAALPLHQHGSYPLLDEFLHRVVGMQLRVYLVEGGSGIVVSDEWVDDEVPDCEAEDGGECCENQG